MMRGRKWLLEWLNPTLLRQLGSSLRGDLSSSSYELEYLAYIHTWLSMSEGGFCQLNQYQWRDYLAMVLLLRCLPSSFIVILFSRK
jgi:hypothetical protein